MTATSAAHAAHCAVLHLALAHSADELNAAYRPLIVRWHPDRHFDTPAHAIALERAKAINEAYAFLSARLAEKRTPLSTEPPGASRESRPASPDGFPDASVLEIFVKPSNVISVGYNSATADLYVKYVGHRIYRYRGVPLLAFEALLLASSASAFVHEHIDRQYAHEAIKRIT